MRWFVTRSKCGLFFLCSADGKDFPAQFRAARPYAPEGTPDSGRDDAWSYCRGRNNGGDHKDGMAEVVRSRKPL